MGTRSTGKNTVIQPDSKPAIGLGGSSKPKAQWTTNNERALVLFLQKHKSEAGDGGNFKPPVWHAAAAEMEKHTTEGAQKTWKACQTKWGRVRNSDIHPIFIIIKLVSNRSRTLIKLSICL